MFKHTKILHLYDFIYFNKNTIKNAGYKFYYVYYRIKSAVKTDDKLLMKYAYFFLLLFALFGQASLADPLNKNKLQCEKKPENATDCAQLATEEEYKNIARIDYRLRKDTIVDNAKEFIFSKLVYHMPEAIRLSEKFEGSTQLQKRISKLRNSCDKATANNEKLSDAFHYFLRESEKRAAVGDKSFSSSNLSPELAKEAFINKYRVAFLERYRLMQVYEKGSSDEWANAQLSLSALATAYPMIAKYNPLNRLEAEDVARLFAEHLRPPANIQFMNEAKKGSGKLTPGVIEGMDTQETYGNAFVEDLYKEIQAGKRKDNFTTVTIEKQLDEFVAFAFQAAEETCTSDLCGVVKIAPEALPMYFDQNSGLELLVKDDLCACPGGLTAHRYNNTLDASQSLATPLVLFGGFLCLSTGYACYPAAALTLAIAGVDIFQIDQLSKQREVWQEYYRYQRWIDSSRSDNAERQNAKISRAINGKSLNVALSAFTPIKGAKVLNLELRSAALEKQMAGSPEAVKEIESLVKDFSEKTNTMRFGLTQAEAAELSSAAKELPAKAQEKITAMKQALYKAETERPSFAINNQLTNAKKGENFFQSLPADKLKSKALLEMFAHLHEKKFIANYMDGLAVEIFQAMKASGNPKMLAKLEKGEFDKGTARKVLLDRLEKKGIDTSYIAPLPVGSLQSFTGFRLKISEGPPVDWAFAGSSHGVFPHIIQADMISEDLVRGFGSTKAAYEYFSTNRGLKFWNEAFDRFRGTSSAMSDTINIKKLIGEPLKIE